jgi:cell division protein ZapA (FtsZ GTPase activity inhibitor)
MTLNQFGHVPFEKGLKIMEKKSYKFEIADVSLAIRSDENEETIKKVVSKLDKEIRDLCINNKQCSKLDAAFLCCLDYSCDNVKLQKRIRNLEAQISLYDVNLKRLHDEVETLTKKLDATISKGRPAAAKPAEKPEKTPAAPAAKTETIKAEKPKEKSEEPADKKNYNEKIDQIESLLKRKASFESQAPHTDSTGEVKNLKIQEIEALLRKNDK